MIKIAIDCEPIEEDSWGVARMISQTLQEISKRPELQERFKFVLFFKRSVPKLSYLDAPIFEKRVLRIPWTPVSFSFYYYVYIPIWLWFHPVDVTYFINYMLPLIFFGKSIVMMTDDLATEMKNPQLPFRYRLAYNIFYRWAARRATRIMAISETSKNELRKIFDISPHRIFVNHLGITTTSATRSAEPALFSQYLLFVGQSFPRRHTRETLLAFEQIAKDFPSVNFIIVGVERYRPPILKKLVDDINRNLGSRRVVWLESTTDEQLANLYKNAIALAYISDREAFGLPPIEALAHGTPPIIADNELGHEIFSDNAFFVTQPLEVASIAGALREALANEPKRRQIIQSQESVALQFTWVKHLNRFIHAAEELIPEKASADVALVLSGGIDQRGKMPSSVYVRVKKAVELLKAGAVKKIIMCGKISYGSIFSPPVSEAAAMKQAALRYGANENEILLEEESKDTVGNIYFAKINYLEPNNWKRVFVITSDFHLERSRYICQKVLGNGYHFWGVPTPVTWRAILWQKARFRKELKALRVTREWLGHIPDGDHKAIWHILSTKHPGYSENPAISREELMRMAGRKPTD